MKWPWKVLSALATLALLAYFIWFAARALDPATFRAVFATPSVVAALVFAALLYALIVPITAWAWIRLLAKQGERWTVWRLAKLLGLAQLAKYVPGNIAQHATRMALALRAGMQGRAFVASVIQETAFAVAASILVGFAMLLVADSGLSRLSGFATDGLLILAVGLGVLVLLFAAVEFRPDRTDHASKRWEKLIARVGGLPGPVASLSAMGAYAANYLLIGLGLWLLATSARLPQSLSYPLVTAAFALSWVLGFLAPGAPAGLGVREATMLLLLSRSAEEDALFVFVVLARAATLLGDLICFLVSAVAGRHAATKTTFNNEL